MVFLKEALIQRIVDIGIAKAKPRPFGLEISRKITIFVPDIEADQTLVNFEKGIRTLFEEYEFASISISGEVEKGGQKNVMIEIMRREKPDRKPTPDPYEIQKDPYETPTKPSSVF